MKNDEEEEAGEEEEEEDAASESSSVCGADEEGHAVAEFVERRRAELQERIREANRFSALCPPR